MKLHPLTVFPTLLVFSALTLPSTSAQSSTSESSTSPLSATQSNTNQTSANNVSRAARLASDLGPIDGAQPITLTVHLKSPNQAAFDKAVAALYDPDLPPVVE